MSSTKLTPLEVLQRQKASLRLKSDELTEILENDLNYIQRNLRTIVNNTVMEGVVSKTPPLVQSLLGRSKNPETGRSNRSSGLITGALDILPFFVKGSKGWMVRLVLNLAKKWISKQSGSGK